MNYKSVAVKAAKKAGALLLKEYAKFNRSTIKMKSQHEIVTKADLISERAIIREVKLNFPEHSILSEEEGQDRGNSEFIWIIDPLDGTTNFSMHNPLWAVSIGLAKDKEIILGVVYAPFLDELYLAEKEKGAFLNNKKLRVSDINTGKVLNTFCHGSKPQDIKRAVKYYNKQKLDGFDCRQMGSASIELGFVAAGRTESIAIPGANAWDVAAGVLLVEEAGGRVTDFKGIKWNLDSKDMLATNGLVHTGLLKAIK